LLLLVIELIEKAASFC